MSFYVTFYSYKGGVGRTLALANVAWLMANHQTEPARVLIIDFDLGAPGLYQVFGMNRAKAAHGIVDYVTDYLADARIPDISRYIHNTLYPGIDIIPAGRMDSKYQRRLESIDWKLLYEGAFGYELFERLKTDISNLLPEYDYVLIDSLTGYSDVGGICVNQLPDSLILLFRLNRQNLDGIETVNRALATRDENKKRLVLPVITPSWPFIDEAAEGWINKAQALFAGKDLLEISFDSSLSFGERIISESASKLPFTSKVLSDYRKLASRVREDNFSDPLTIWRSLMHDRQSLIDEPGELYLRLLKRRPLVLQYWRHMPLIVQDPRYRRRSEESLSPVLKRLMDFTDQECENGNKFALLGRSQIWPYIGSEVEEDKAREDLDKALQIDPIFFEARIQRGHLAVRQDRFNDAILDFSDSLQSIPEQDMATRKHVETVMAATYLKLLDGEEALSRINSAIGSEQPEMRQYLIRGKAHYLVGDYESALSDVRRYTKSGSSDEPTLLLPSQILAVMGRTQEASEELASFSRNIDRVSMGNLAEAYLAVDPNKTLSILSENSREPRPAVQLLLRLLARIFLGEDIATIAKEISSELRVEPDRYWGTFEVIALLRAKERARDLTAEAAAIAYEAIRFSISSKNESSI